MTSSLDEIVLGIPICKQLPRQGGPGVRRDAAANGRHEVGDGTQPMNRSEFARFGLVFISEAEVKDQRQVIGSPTG